MMWPIFSQRRPIGWVLIVAGAWLVAASRGAEPEVDANGVQSEGVQSEIEACVGRLLAISDTVLEHHIDPPTRQEMLLGAARALYGSAGLPLPAGMSRRI